MTLARTEPKSIKLWTTDIKKVYLGSTLVRPPIVNWKTQWPCPDGFHVPLNTEWTWLTNIRTALWWDWRDWLNFSAYLRLPYAWYRSFQGSTSSQNSTWYYWTSKWTWNNTYYLYLDNSSISTYSLNRASALTIRPFKNVPVIPTSSWVKLYGTSIEAGWIFINNSEWLISLSGDWQTWVTIANKNLWATNVWTYWSALSEANCGKYYQWGNNYWFPFTWTITTSSTKINAQSYWPWNYYSSSTYIAPTSTPYNWDSSGNLNIRWWEDGNVPV